MWPLWRDCPPSPQPSPAGRERESRALRALVRHDSSSPRREGNARHAATCRLRPLLTLHCSSRIGAVFPTAIRCPRMAPEQRKSASEARIQSLDIPINENLRLLAANDDRTRNRHPELPTVTAAAARQEPEQRASGADISLASCSAIASRPPQAGGSSWLLVLALGTWHSALSARRSALGKARSASSQRRAQRICRVRCRLRCYAA